MQVVQGAENAQKAIEAIEAHFADDSLTDKCWNFLHIHLRKSEACSMKIASPRVPIPTNSILIFVIVTNSIMCYI